MTIYLDGFARPCQCPTWFHYVYRILGYIDHLKRMEKSGCHDQELQKRLVKIPFDGGQYVILCDFCLSRIMEAQQQEEI